MACGSGATASCNTDFDIAIENKIDSVALFLVLHSRAQRNSEYCTKELDWFSDKYRDHMLVGEQRRIFNVLLNNIPARDWHPALEGTIGFIMHDAEGDELGDFTDPKDGRYGKQLRKVVDAAETTLNAMRAQQQAARPDPVPNTTVASGQLPTLFLASVSETQETTRERLITEIGDSARLLAELPPPHEHAPAGNRSRPRCSRPT